jgi:hypothetical protein
MPRFDVEIRERNGDPSYYSMTAETPENALYYVWEQLAGTGCDVTGRIEDDAKRGEMIRSESIRDESTPAEMKRNDLPDPGDEIPYWPDQLLT